VEVNFTKDDGRCKVQRSPGTGLTTDMAKKSKVGECGYCGHLGQVTQEHVMPRCIFPFGVPPDSPQITACKHCNHAKSRFDSILRDALCLDVVGSTTAQARKINLESKTILVPSNIHGAPMRSALRGSSEFVDAMLNSPVEHHEANVFSSTITTPVVQNDSAAELASEAVAWVTRGLYFLETKKVLTIESCDSFRSFPIDFDDVAWRGSQMRVLSGNAGKLDMHWTLGVTDELEGALYALIVFWNRVVFEFVANVPDCRPNSELAEQLQ
jgi:hypothetical protein